MEFKFIMVGYSEYLWSKIVRARPKSKNWINWLIKGICLRFSNAGQDWVQDKSKTKKTNKQKQKK